ncbi:MOSC domain-containing protein [Novipirellula aureliae]|nr:MOSC domain-containing protein [Novipirellula aureliae]
MPCPKVLSIQVGRPQHFDDVDSPANRPMKPWTSGIVKQLVNGPVMVRCTNIDGDEQADLVHHGGVDKAVLAYSVLHYAFWKTQHQEVEWQAGCFGENLTLDGVTEADVCIGDQFEIGSCVLQISQPRQPCWKLSRRWNLPKLAVQVQQTRRTGWYLRVIKEGVIEAGQTMRLVERPYPRWTIEKANSIMFAKPRDPVQDQALAECTALSASWRETLGQRSLRSNEQILQSEKRRLSEDPFR